MDKLIAHINPFIRSLFDDAMEEEWPSRDAVPIVREADVTLDMAEAGQQMLRQTEKNGGEWGPSVVCIYRAMHAVAPVELVSEGERMAEQEAGRARREACDAYGYLRRIFEHIAPQCTPLDDLMGICTQVDNALAGAIQQRHASRQIELLQARNRVLEARSNAEPIYDGGPDHLAALAGERDRALSRASHAMENWTTAVRERDAARADTDEMALRLTYWRQLATRYDREIQDASATIAALAIEKNHIAAELATFREEHQTLMDVIGAQEDVIAKLTASAVPDTSRAAPNPFREFGGDRRRIGG